MHNYRPITFVEVDSNAISDCHGDNRSLQLDLAGAFMFSTSFITLGVKKAITEQLTLEKEMTDE